MTVVFSCRSARVCITASAPNAKLRAIRPDDNKNANKCKTGPRPAKSAHSLAKKGNGHRHRHQWPGKTNGINGRKRQEGDGDEIAGECDGVAADAEKITPGIFDAHHLSPVPPDQRQDEDQTDHRPDKDELERGIGDALRLDERGHATRDEGHVQQ
jgi:hypothetical protein